MVKKQQQQK